MHGECVLALLLKVRERNPISSGSRGRACSGASFHLWSGEIPPSCWHLPGAAPLPQLLELRNWNCGIAVMEERQVKLPWGEGEQLLTEHGGGGVK